MMTPEQYVYDVRQLIVKLRNALTDSEVAEVNHLVECGEPAEGLRTLAWIIFDEKKNVNNASIVAIITLMGDLVSEADLPPDFAKYGID